MANTRSTPTPARKTEIRTPGGRRVAVGQHWRNPDDGYLVRVVAICADGKPYARHVNAKSGGGQVVPAWFDEWELTKDVPREQNAGTPHTRALEQTLEQALAEAVNALPDKQRRYGHAIARATVAGERSHGQRDPNAPPKLDSASVERARHTVDAAWDRVRAGHLKTNMRVRVRCWPDDMVRDGTIQSLQYGASAPICVLVDYPDQYREPGGLEPINPSGYPLERIVEPRSPYEPGGEPPTSLVAAEADALSAFIDAVMRGVGAAAVVGVPSELRGAFAVAREKLKAPAAPADGEPGDGDEPNDQEEIDALYRVANDHEASVLDDLRRRAGTVWECYGRTGEGSCWTNPRDSGCCDHCGVPREIGALEDYQRPDPPSVIAEDGQAFTFASKQQRAAHTRVQGRCTISAVALLSDANLAVTFESRRSGRRHRAVIAPDGRRVTTREVTPAG